MRLRKLYACVAPIVVLAGIGCQTAQKPAPLLSTSQATPPALIVARPQVSTSSQVPTPHEPSEYPPVTAGAGPRAEDVSELIDTVEKEYQAGQEEYRAGHLEAAKQSFDRAFDLLLGSDLDVSSDARLQEELDRVLDGVNGFELTALQEGDGFTEQKSEPAPIDEANEVTFPVDPNVKAQAEAEVKSTHSDLRLMMTDQVAGYINYFSTRGRGTLEHALARSGRYQEMIRQTLKDEAVPQDLIYLAQAESGFHPLALSRAGARGMWQFMGSRARGYGLERNWWVDERQDPEKATRAAARHLKDLYNQFGDWYLAMAAYNSGPGTVQNAVKRTGYADFWELYNRNVLPKETRNYVPIILAVAIMAKNPAQYGLDKVVLEQPVPFDSVTIDYPVDLRLVAECVDASVDEVQDLNPSLIRMTTPKDERFNLHLPMGTSDKFATAIAAVPLEMRVWWRYHKVQPGDTLASIARAYHTNVKVIAEANNLSGDNLDGTNKLIIPISPGKRASDGDLVAYSRHATRYKVRKGDTVQTVADNFGVPATMVRRWNHVKGDSLKGRTVLYVHLPVTKSYSSQSAARKPDKTRHSKSSQTTAKSGVVRHTVKQGETLTSIASSYKMSVATLKHDNQNIATLRPGMVLVIRESR